MTDPEALIERLTQSADDIRATRMPRHNAYLLLREAAVALAEVPQPEDRRQCQNAGPTCSGDWQDAAISWHDAWHATLGTPPAPATPAPTCDRPGAKHHLTLNGREHYVAELSPARWVPCPAETAATQPVATCDPPYFRCACGVSEYHEGHIPEEPAPPSDAQVEAGARAFQKLIGGTWDEAYPATKEYRLEVSRAVLLAAAGVTE